MTLSQQQIDMLNAPLDSSRVKKPSGNFGPKGDYLEGWHVINELNRVFGFDGWSYMINLTRDSLEQIEVEKTDYRTKEKVKEPQWQAAYTCVCTLTIGATVRQDVGFGSGFAKMISDAVEGATKEAATDSLKRCARTFGNIFGLALYDKSRTNVADPVLETTQRLLNGIASTATLKGLYEWKALNGDVVNASPDKRQVAGVFAQHENDLKQKEAA
jgi:DNA repair and recombination protein RAD52